MNVGPTNKLWKLLGVEGRFTAWSEGTAIHNSSHCSSVHLLVQLVPSSLYPGLQTQVKPPTVLVQSALVSQLSLSAAHSSMSSVMDDVRVKNKIYLITSAREAIPTVSLDTSTDKASHSVGAVGINSVTVISVSSTFINIWKIVRMITS